MRLARAGACRNSLDAVGDLGHDRLMVGAGIEGVGDALTGGIIARQFEPGAGEAHESGHGGDCLNCGAALTGPYCHRCGQPAHVHRSLAAFWQDFAHGVVHFEGKIWRTLPLLAWRPGQLTRRYIDGERARFVSPVALFLFSVFLMFAVFNSVGGPVFSHEQAKSYLTMPEGPSAQLKLLREQRANMAAAGENTAAIDLSISTVREQAARQKGSNAGVIDVGGTGGLRWLDEAYRKGQENRALLAYKLQSNAYKFSWMLIPISMPFVWIMFLHRRRYRQYKAYDHTVFVTYSLAFITLLTVALSLLHALFLPAALGMLVLTFVPPVHIYRQLGGTYALRWHSALWRTFVLVFFGCITSATLFLLLLLALGVMH
jgi:hypothetical protein